MLKRTKGRLLLTLLVITGLAGTLKDTSLSHKERKSAMTLMRDTRTAALRSIKGLSAKQLNFKNADGSWSIKECIYHIATSEKNLWNTLEVTLKSPATPENRDEIKITDDELIQMIENNNFKFNEEELFQSGNKTYKSVDDALNAFKSGRTNHIKYIRTTTEDLRNHVVQMQFGAIDCYQLCLVMASLSNRYMQQIEEIKKDSKFPKQ